MTVATPQRAERAFDALGSRIRVISADPAALELAERFVLAAEARLSRFEPRSELCALNRDPRDEVPASGVLRGAVAAALWAAERSGGLVDPTLLGELRRSGYDRTHERLQRVPLAVALEHAPARAPAAPHPGRAWARVTVDRAIRRPAGIQLDLGGSGKGWIADAVASRIGEGIVDCGGDIRVNGNSTVAVEHPLTGELVHSLDVRDGAIATSGLARRVWMTPDGPSHHLLDPATGRPAWTGLIAVTALAPTALEAETLAKAALLSGPAGARRRLVHGGLLFHDDGDLEVLDA